MKTALFSLIGLLLAIVYMVFLASLGFFSLLILPVAWIVAVWMLHGLSRAYIVALCVGILLDLHYFNFGLITLILLAALSAVYFVHVTVVSSANAASTLTLGFLLPLVVYMLLWVSLGISNGFHYYQLTGGLLLSLLISSGLLSVLASSYIWLFKKVTS